MKIGDKGFDVKRLQRDLTSLGYSLGGIDGDFGLKTETAVKQFQKDNALTVNGEVREHVLEIIAAKIKERVILDYTKFDWTPIINWETGGQAYYDKYLKFFTYPGGASGCTIACGVDCAYYSEKELCSIFNFLSKKDQDLIIGARGKTGAAAQAYLPKLKHIQVSWEKSLEIFYKTILPKFYSLTLFTWPGVDQLKEKAQIALTSLIFNRGGSLLGDSRREMAAIKSLVLVKDYKGMAREVRSMKRLWINKGLDGLLKRREEEARMLEG